jgi:hypothetical protein
LGAIVVSKKCGGAAFVRVLAMSDASYVHASQSVVNRVDDAI